MVVLDEGGSDARTITLKRRAGCECSVNGSTATATGPTTASPGEDGPSCPMPWNAPDVEAVSAAEYEEHKSEVFLLDVREPDEFEEWHIPNAYLIPLGQLMRRLAEVPRDRAVVCVCSVGGRSARAADYLRSQGIKGFNLRGGMRSWMATAKN